MVDAKTLYYRKETHCIKCEWWYAGKCRKGHLLSSPAGCPIKKFPPVLAASYAPDREPDPLPEKPPAGCAECGVAGEGMPDLSWRQVLAQFGQSMITWVQRGLPLVERQEHGQRTSICETCEFRRNFWCTVCKCVYYAKAKLATEDCPKKKWPIAGPRKPQ